MNVGIKRYLRFSKKWNIWKNLTNNQYKYYFKKIKGNFRIFENRNVRERTLLNAYVYKIASR